MKKLGLTFAAIGFFFATTTQAQVAETTTEVQTEVRTSVENDYEKVEIAELPQAVATAVSTDYAGATTEEAWVKEKEGKQVYKLKLSGQEEHVYVDAEGNWIEKDKKKKD